jgi:hypothetical protein
MSRQSSALKSTAEKTPAPKALPADAVYDFNPRRQAGRNNLSERVAHAINKKVAIFKDESWDRVEPGSKVTWSKVLKTTRGTSGNESLDNILRGYSEHGMYHLLNRFDMVESYIPLRGMNTKWLVSIIDQARRETWKEAGANGDERQFKWVQCKLFLKTLRETANFDEADSENILTFFNANSEFLGRRNWL